ncbi:MAG: NusG domain II-containing protein [Fidelibacterota bacterium]|nr:MAG: NusG domain II-containing protein [Candidatus Neomarinimicrobiota bacterium]
MDNISRRRFLHVSALLGVGAISGGLTWLRPRLNERSYFLITDSPAVDFTRLLRITGLAEDKGASIEYTRIQPSSLDLGIIDNGRLINPRRLIGLEPELADFANALWARKSTGEHLIKIETPRFVRNDQVLFEVDGSIVEQVGLRNNYRQIAIVGKDGDTSFELKDGFLSVTRASCRHEVCKKTGPTYSGRIICAPNKLVATINHAHRPFDGITG